MHIKNAAFAMGKQADSGFSSAGSGESSQENHQRESENSCSLIISNMNNLDKCKRMSSYNDDKNKEHENFKWNKELCEDIFKLPYEFFYQQDDDGDTRLHATITLGLLEATYWLINLAPHPSLLDIVNDDGLTALHLAVIARDARIVRRLVLSGANKLLRTSITGNTSLHLACARNDIDCVKALTEPLTAEERYYCSPKFQENVTLNIYLELKNYNGETCLHIAASQGHLDLVRYLLHIGADVYAHEGLRGMTALHLALENNHVNVVWFLANERPFCIDTVTYAGLSTYQIAKRLDRQFADKLVRLRYKCASKVDVENELSAFARMRVCLAT